MGVTVMLRCPSSASKAASENTSLPPRLSQFPMGTPQAPPLPLPQFVAAGKLLRSRVHLHRAHCCVSRALSMVVGAQLTPVD